MFQRQGTALKPSKKVKLRKGAEELKENTIQRAHEAVSIQIDPEVHNSKDCDEQQVLSENRENSNAVTVAHVVNIETRKIFENNM